MGKVYVRGQTIRHSRPSIRSQSVGAEWLIGILIIPFLVHFLLYIWLPCGLLTYRCYCYRYLTISSDIHFRLVVNLFLTTAICHLNLTLLIDSLQLLGLPPFYCWWKHLLTLLRVKSIILFICSICLMCKNVSLAWYINYGNSSAFRKRQSHVSLSWLLSVVSLFMVILWSMETSKWTDIFPCGYLS